jgi:hypothetical protein
MTNTKDYDCCVIFAESGEDFQQYHNACTGPVLPGTPVGVEITQDGTTELYLYDDIQFN